MKPIILVSRTMKFVALISLFIVSIGLKAQSLGVAPTGTRFSPNPFDEVINISMSQAPSSSMTFQLRNMGGMVQFQQTITGANSQVNTTSVARGKYIAFLLDNKGATIHREGMTKVDL